MVHINNPLPQSLNAECRKAARILASFVDPRQAFGPDKIIPPSVLSQAKGLAVLTVVKLGFLVTARGGSGLVIARRPDGSWSAPSAIGTAGAGLGSQLGAEITDFVMILNDASAVRTFAQQGSLTLGGNVSIAAGPVGRNAEASGAASTKGVAGIFSYSKTKGLFAGISLEGSVILERKDANAKFYNGPVSARQLLSGTVTPPPECDALLRILGSRVFTGISPYGDDLYNDIPHYDDYRDDSAWENRSRSGSLGNTRNSPTFGAPSRAATWAHDEGRNTSAQQSWEFGASEEKRAPGRPTAPKPNFRPAPRAKTLGANQAVALYTFEAAQEGDLGFRKGDVINITKRTESKNDWWTGELNGKTGIFPSNYVETL